MMKNIIISKLDAARRQLITAIRLYFNNGDIVSMHTLTSTAFKITQNISDSSTNLPESITNWVDKFVKPEFKKLFWGKFHEATNFFKHAEKDPESVHKFNPELTEIILYITTNQYQRLTGEVSPEMHLFISWYMLQKPDIFELNKEQQKILQFTRRDFSGHDKNQFWREVMPLYQELIDKGLTDKTK